MLHNKWGEERPTQEITLFADFKIPPMYNVVWKSHLTQSQIQYYDSALSCVCYQYHGISLELLVGILLGMQLWGKIYILVLCLNKRTSNY